MNDTVAAVTGGSLLLLKSCHHSMAVPSKAAVAKLVTCLARMSKSSTCSLIVPSQALVSRAFLPSKELMHSRALIHRFSYGAVFNGSASAILAIGSVLRSSWLAKPNVALLSLRKEVAVQKDSGSAHSRFARTRASKRGPRDSLRSHLPTSSRRC